MAFSLACDAGKKGNWDKMRKFVFLLLVLFLTSVCCYAQPIGPFGVPSRGVKASSMGFKNAVFVDRGDDLQAKYNWLKSSDRDAQCGAIDVNNNRRTLVLCPGRHYPLATDTDFVVAIKAGPAPPGISRSANVVTAKTITPLYPVVDEIVVIAGVDDASFDGTFTITVVDSTSQFKYDQTGDNATSNNGTATITRSERVLTLDTDGVDLCSLTSDEYDTVISAVPDENSPEHMIIQTANDVKISFLTMISTVSPGKSHPATFVINASDNSASIYNHCRFMNDYPAYSVYGLSDVNGTWTNCYATWGFCFMATNKTLGATMRDITAENYSYGGDGTGVTISGKFYNCTGGEQSFGGCAISGCEITSAAYFENCRADSNSFALGKTCAGTFKRCVGGENSFGGYASTVYGTFSGYAEDCNASGRSFGSGHASSKNSGTIVNSTITDMPAAMYCEGATIRNSRLVVDTNNVDCLVLTDSNSVIYNSDLIVYQGGSGIPIKATTAQNVVAAHCRMNNASNDADGLDPNVTNLIGTSYNIVDDDIE